MRKKITVVGAGHVGATTAQLILYKELADVVLIDILEGIPQGKGLDLMESAPLESFSSLIKGTNKYEDTADSNLVVITAGVPRKPGMSREDLLKINANIVREVTTQIVKYSPDCIIIIVSNPLDAMAYLAKNVSKFPRNRIIGMSGVLDTTRFRTFIALELGVGVADVQAMVLGGHGDTMVPLARYSTISGIPLSELLSEEQISRLSIRAQNGGSEIVNLLKTGSAYYSPASSIVQMAEAIIKDNKRILPCAAYLEGEYGFKDIFMGVPVKLSSQGIEKIIELKLNQEEFDRLKKSAQAVETTREELKKVLGN